MKKVFITITLLVFCYSCAVGKTVYLRHLSPDCRRLLKNAEAIIDVNIIEDPTYNLVGSDAN